MHRASIFVSIIAVVLLGLIALDRTAPSAAQDASPMAGEQGFTGAWRVTVTPDQGPPGMGVGTLGADGTIVTSVQPVVPSPGAPGGVIFTSAGQGVWEATGPETAILTFVVVAADGQGNRFGTQTVRASITLGADGQAFSGEASQTISDPAGNTVATMPGTVQATRIVAEAPGTPAVATPAV